MEHLTLVTGECYTQVGSCMGLLAARSATKRREHLVYVKCELSQVAVVCVIMLAVSPAMNEQWYSGRHIAAVECDTLGTCGP
jgi:hypothetical protein